MSILDTAKSAVSGFFTGFWAKAMSYLLYVAIGITLVLGAAAIWFYKQNAVLSTKVGTLDQTSINLAGQVTALQMNNNQQDQAIADLVQQRQTDGHIVQGLIDDYKGLSNESATTKAKIRDLEHKSDEVKAYLSSPLPASVRSVLNGKDQAGAADNVAPGASAQPVPDQHADGSGQGATTGAPATKVQRP